MVNDNFRCGFVKCDAPVNLKSKDPGFLYEGVVDKFVGQTGCSGIKNETC
jgi:hypothetical protein